MKQRRMISLKCPICLKERTVRFDGHGSACKSCRARENSKNKIGRYKDITGLTFGELKVISCSGLKPLYALKAGYYWLCRCSCGNELEVFGGRLRSGNAKSCGCLYKTQNGLSTSPAYRSWDAMIQRCHDSRVEHFKRYGAKGITVCDRWKNSFLNFYEDMGARPNGLTLDRIDPHGNYCKENCRWSSNKTQGRNRCNNRIIEAFGKKQTLTDWAEEIGIHWGTLLKRINAGWTPEDAITRKVLKWPPSLRRKRK